MKNLIFICFSLICSVTFGQQHATPNTKCQLVVDDILRQQSFDIDAPVSEEARYIFFEMYEGLNHIYLSSANDPKRAEYIDNFKKTLLKADDLNLNLIMFQEDIDYVSTLTQ